MFDYLKRALVLSLIIGISCEDSEKWKSVIKRTRNLSQTIINYNLSNAADQSRDQYNDERCLREVISFYEGIDQLQHWAIKMYDSWGNFPSGILSGNVFSLGNFDECSVVDSQYCLVEVEIRSSSSRLITWKPEIINFKNPIKIFMGTCYPASCSPNLTAILYEIFIDEHDVVVSPSGIKCSINDSSNGFEFTIMPLFTMCLFGLISFLIISSTVVELFVEIRKSNTFLKVWKAFSAYQNLSDLCDTQTGDKENTNEIKFACFDGLRAISIIWVAYGHSVVNMQRSAVINKVDIISWSQNLWTIISWTIFNFAVDTFFVIGGFLATRSIKNQFEHDHRSHIKKFLSIPRMWFHRYLRLAPVVISGVLFFTTIGTQLGKGPFWNSTIEEIEICYHEWWSTILFVQNYVSAGKMCFGHLWYLAVDIQMFMMTSILLFIIHWKGLRYVCIIIAMILTNIFYNLYMHFTSVYFITDKEPNQDERDKLIYYPTHARMMSWLSGVMLAIIYLKYFKKRENFKISSIILLFEYLYCLLVLALIVANISITTSSLSEEHSMQNAIIESISRFLWSSAIGLIIFNCITNNGGPINKFLSSPIWKPLAKLSFCIYVLHYVIQLLLIGKNRTTVYMDNISLVENFWSDFGITVTVSMFWTLAFEMPFRIIERIDWKQSNILAMRNQESYVNEGAE